MTVHVTKFMYFAALYCLYFASDRRERRCDYTFDITMMVPIDSSRQELSNGCHIVFWSNFDLIAENPGCGLDFKLVGRSLAYDLADLIGKRCSNEAKYTTNR